MVERFREFIDIVKEDAVELFVKGMDKRHAFDYLLCSHFPTVMNYEIIQQAMEEAGYNMNADYSLYD